MEYRGFLHSDQNGLLSICGRTTPQTVPAREGEPPGPDGWACLSSDQNDTRRPAVTGQTQALLVVSSAFLLNAMSPCGDNTTPNDRLKL